MDVYYTDELPRGICFEVNGILVIGTSEENHPKISKIPPLINDENKEPINI